MGSVNLADPQVPVKIVSKKENFFKLAAIAICAVFFLFFLGQFFVAMPLPFLVFIFFIVIVGILVYFLKGKKAKANAFSVGLEVAQEFYERTGSIIDTSPQNLQIVSMGEDLYYLHDKSLGLVLGYHPVASIFESSLSNVAQTRRRLERTKYFAAFAGELSAKKKLESIKDEMGIKEVN